MKRSCSPRPRRCCRADAPASPRPTPRRRPPAAGQRRAAAARTRPGRRRACRRSTTSRRPSRATSSRSSGSRPTTTRRPRSGHVTFAKPGKMEWVLRRPEGQPRRVRRHDHQGLRGQQQADVRAAASTSRSTRRRCRFSPAPASWPTRSTSSSFAGDEMKFPGGYVLVGHAQAADARVLEGALLRRRGHVAGPARDDHRRPGQPEPLRLRQPAGQRAGHADAVQVHAAAGDVHHPPVKRAR